MKDGEYYVSYVYQDRFGHKHETETLFNDNPINYINSLNDNCMFDDGEYILTNFWRLEEDNE